MVDYRHSKSFGERCEYIAMAELLKRGFDVYKTLVDDSGIDCIIKINENRYLDVQIKARSKDIDPGDAALFAGMTLEPRNNYFFIFYSQHLDTYWIVPSQELTKIAYKNKKGKNIGSYVLWFNGMKNGVPYAKERFDQYKNENGFKLIK